MSALPEISVILPAYNARRTIARAIASLRAQTFAHWELIVVDDGSLDDTAATAMAAADGDARIRILSRSRGGLVAALNAGIASTTGPLIARMDADDECHPERLSAQRDLLRRHPECGLCSCLVEFGGCREASAGYALHVDWINTLLEPEQIALNRFVESPLAHPSVLFRRSCVEQHGAYREGDFPEDYELWLRWLDAGVRMMKVPRALLRWNDSPARLSRSDARYAADRFFATKAPWLARELGRRLAGSARSVWLWGAGRPTRQRAAHLAAFGVRLAGYIDIDPKKTGRRIAGAPVISPAELPDPRAAFVLGYVSSRGARELIRAALGARGYQEGSDFLMCA